METRTCTTIHPFEKAGLGKAPFTCTGVEEKVYKPNAWAEAKPGGCCDYCAAGIRYCYHILSADGKRFVVGCDCVMKVYREDNRKIDPLLAKVNDLRRKIEREARHEREAARIAAGIAAVEPHKATLATMPHPTTWRAEKGETALDWFEWYMKNAGTKGTLDALAYAKKLLGL